MNTLKIDLSNELIEVFKNFDAAAYEKRISHAEQVLGIAKAKTEYLGERSKLKGITTWIDTRNNISHELITTIKIEIFGTKRFRHYHHNGYFNGRLWEDYIKSSLTKKELIESHELQKSMLFSKLCSFYRDNIETTFEDLSYRDT